MAVRVLGVDGCPGGWIGIALDPDGPRAYAAPDLATLLDRVDEDGPLGVVGVDIPIGLADETLRRADVEAQAALGPRRSSLFVTPVRSALELDDYAAAVARNRAVLGQGFSRQAYGLRAKILEVDALVGSGENRLLEVHPELSFATLAGGPLQHGKKTWAGARERRQLLAGAGIDIGDDLPGEVARAGVDDVLDAAVVAWTARRRTTGLAVCRPDPPDRFSDGIAAAIWS